MLNFFVQKSMHPQMGERSRLKNATGKHKILEYTYTSDS